MHHDPRTSFEALESRRLLAAAASAVLTHEYDFPGNLNDALGGAALTSGGGTTLQGGYVFAAGQGLDLAGAVDPTNYSIELDYQFSANASDQSALRVLNFLGSASDSGVYEGNGLLNFIDSAGSVQPSVGGAVANGVPKRLIVTRDGNTNIFAGYLNGVRVMTFIDSALDTQLTTVGGKSDVSFFQDNTSGVRINENGPGSVTRIRVFQNALTQDQVTFIQNGGDPAAFGRIQVINGTLTIAGTENNDTISITKSGANLVTVVDSYSSTFAATDVSRYLIQGNAGNDRIALIGTGLPGGSIFGGDGNDTLVGGDGVDVIYGNAGKDKILGGLGNDVLRGNGGNDQIFGEAGGDRIYGYDGADYLDGGSSGDRIFAGDGADTVFGQGGNDTILTAGDNSIDSVFGGTGTDSAQKDSIDLVISVEVVLP